MSMNVTDQIFIRLNNFIRKYYQNQLIKGGIYTIAILVIFFILFTTIEYFSSFGVTGRTILFWSYIIINLLVFARLIIIPLLNIFKIGKTLRYKEAARIIGNHFPEIDDKLLNLLELSELSDVDNSLIQASISQKTKNISPVSFKNAIDFSVNKKYLKWVAVPLSILALLFISGNDYIFRESSARIIKHNSFFEPQSPFNYIIINKNLNCVEFDDFLLEIKIEGNQIPRDIYISYGKNKYKMNKIGTNKYDYLFSRVHSNINFQFTGGGYFSKEYTIISLLQPKVVNMDIEIFHPKHTNKKNEIVSNNGDIIISEGSFVEWKIKLKNSDKYLFLLGNKVIDTGNKKILTVKKQIFKNEIYSIITSNLNSLSDTLVYSIQVIKDEFPKINLEQNFDTLSNNYLYNGVVEDDYSINKLEFHYEYKNQDSTIKVVDKIIIESGSFETFLHSFNFNNIKANPGETINYYFKVWDNDGINGSKFSISQKYIYKESSIDDLIIRKNIENEKIKSGLNQSIMLAEEIQKDIKKLNKEILQKNKIGWQDKKKARDILKKQKELEKRIAKTKKDNSNSLKTKEKLNSSILEKQKELEELMNKVLDEEMKKMLEEMEQMLDEVDKEKLKDLLDKLSDENKDLEKELDRELELFKQLEFEQKVEETIEKIKEIKQLQKNLKEETLDKKLKIKNSELAKKQELISEEMDSVKNILSEIKKINMELEDKNKLPKTKKLEDEISQKMSESKDALKKGMKMKSKQLQQKTIENIDQLEQDLKNMQKESSVSKPIEDMETLRQILENLITLSFNQEDLILAVNSTPKNSSEFIQIVKEQGKLSENSKIIKDSLFALSKRVVQIQSTINKEIGLINSNIKKAIKSLEARDLKNGSKRQQFVMTSTNNLALLLSEILEQMQKQLEMPPSNCKKPKNCNKPNPNGSKPSLNELKKAQKKLNEKISKAKKGKKGEKGKGKKQGEEESEQLMNLAKNQQQIRKQLMDLRDEMGKNGEKGKIDNIIDQMEQNETDIINNRILEETIKRQEEILSKLIEAENASKEQGEDEKRESFEWEFDFENETEKFIEYQKQKKSHDELLKTVPIQLTPFYKKKVKRYFNNIIND